MNNYMNNYSTLARMSPYYYITENIACRKTRGPNPLRTIIRILSPLLSESVLKLPWPVEDKDEQNESELNSRSRGRLRRNLLFDSP